METIETDSYVIDALRASSVDRYNHICPDAYKATDFSHPALAAYQTQIAAIRNWKFGPRGIIASGPTGRGKTRALWDLYRRLTCDEVIEARFYYAGDWFNKLQSQVTFGRDEAQEWVEAVARRRVIMIDDFGQEALLHSKADWAAGWFFRFLDLRVGHGLPLIISTNLGARAFEGELRGDPLLRRLLEVCEPVKF